MNLNYGMAKPEVPPRGSGGETEGYPRLVATVDTSAAEVGVLRDACGLVDRSERGKLALTGGEAKAFLSGQVTNDIEALERGRGCYAALLTHKGKMLADLRVLDLGDELWLDTERVALQALFDALRKHLIGFDAELHKRTLAQSLLSLVGPRSREVLGDPDLGDEEHANAPGNVGGTDVWLVVTDAGIDVICAADDAERVVAALVDAGATRVGEEAAEVLRVERGRPRYGMDMDDSTIPQEAGLNERAVSFTKGCYVGQETVARLYYKGKPNRRLLGLRLSAPAQTGEEIRLGERTVGALGTVALSPQHGPIALALVRREAEVGDRVAVGDGTVTAELTELPF
jgi:folate-binding protein YgfZ